MKKEFKPEIGQILFGNPCQYLDCPDNILDVLRSLQSAWGVKKPNTDNPFSNTGAKYNGEVFSVHAYSWSDEDQEWNFKWRDIRISWYKYFGRGTSINRKMSNKEILEMLRECMAELLNLTL